MPLLVFTLVCTHVRQLKIRSVATAVSCSLVETRNVRMSALCNEMHTNDLEAKPVTFFAQAFLGLALVSMHDYSI